MKNEKFLIEINKIDEKISKYEEQKASIESKIKKLKGEKNKLEKACILDAVDSLNMPLDEVLNKLSNMR